MSFIKVKGIKQSNRKQILLNKKMGVSEINREGKVRHEQPPQSPGLAGPRAKM